nr:hypothetical protein CFP56_54115 [Quercus suber]
MKKEDKSSRLHLFLHAEPPPPPHKSPEQNDFEEERVLAIPLLPPLGCAILCLPKPPPHHKPELTATEFAGAVRRAWKQTEDAMSHDPKVCFS